MSNPGLDASIQVLFNGNPSASRAAIAHAELLGAIRANLRRRFGVHLSPSEIEDVAAEAMTRVISKMVDMRKRGEDPSIQFGYFAQTARFAALDYLRRQHRYEHLALETPGLSLDEPLAASTYAGVESQVELAVLGEIASVLNLDEEWVSIANHLTSGRRLTRELRKGLDLITRERARLEIQDHARIVLGWPIAGSLLMEVDRIAHGNDSRLSSCVWIRGMVVEARTSAEELSRCVALLSREFTARNLSHPALLVRRQIGDALERVESRWNRLRQRCFSSPEPEL